MSPLYFQGINTCKLTKSNYIGLMRATNKYKFTVIIKK